MSNARDAISLAVKSHIFGGPTAMGYQEMLHYVVSVYQEHHIPACLSIGTRTHTACGGIMCPTCEFSRRWQFGKSLGWNLRHEADNAYANPLDVAIIQHETRSATLMGLTDTSPGALQDPSILRRFRSLDGLLGWIVNVEWDAAANTWRLFRTAVVTVPPPSFRKTPGITVKRILDCEVCNEESINSNVGEMSAIVLAAITVAKTHLPLCDAVTCDGCDAPLVEAGIALSHMRASNQRLHLLRCRSPQDEDEYQRMCECGY